MKYKVDSLKDLNNAVSDFFAVFKMIVKSYLTDNNEYSLYDNKEIITWIDYILSNKDLDITNDLISKYINPLPLRPYVSQLIHQQFLYRLAAKKYLSLPDSQDPIIEGDKILFSVLTKTIQSNLDVLEEIQANLKFSTYGNIDDCFEILEANLKYNFISEMRKKPALELAIDENNIPSESYIDGKGSFLTNERKVKTPTADLIGKFDSLFRNTDSEKINCDDSIIITRRDTTDSYGEDIEEIVVSPYPVRSSATTVLTSASSPEEIIFPGFSPVNF